MSPSQLLPSEAVATREAILVVNTKSRRGQQWFEDAKNQLQNLGVPLVSARSFTKIEPLKREVQSAIQRKVPLIIAGGGDGTFSSIARFFVNSESTLGVLPLGTGNAFARDLGIPAEVGRACDIIANGKDAGVDLGYAGDDYFLNVATLGLTTQIARNLTDQEKKRWGRFVYAFAIARALRGVKPFRVKIESDNGTTEFETLQVVLGNGRYHAGPFLLSPNASITEGKLTLYALKTTHRSAFVRLALNLAVGKHVDLAEVHSEETTWGTITTTPRLKVTVDGEICEQSPLQYKVLPDVLRVRVPPEFAG